MDGHSPIRENMENRDSLEHSAALDKQHAHWQLVWDQAHPEYCHEPSYAAQAAQATFQKNDCKNILELGSGDGRDSLFFLKNGFHLHAVDYATSSLDQIFDQAKNLGLDTHLMCTCHDIRQPFPFPDDSFDACFSHMLYCMALTDEELHFLHQEIRRILKSGGVNIFTARNTSDPAYGTGINCGTNLYELDGGFIVHFLSPTDIDALIKNDDRIAIETFEEGMLPKRLSLVSIRKPT